MWGGVEVAMGVVVVVVVVMFVLLSVAVVLVVRSVCCCCCYCFYLIDAMVFSLFLPPSVPYTLVSLYHTHQCLSSRGAQRALPSPATTVQRSQNPQLVYADWKKKTHGG